MEDGCSTKIMVDEKEHILIMGGKDCVQIVCQNYISKNDHRGYDTIRIMPQNHCIVYNQELHQDHVLSFDEQHVAMYNIDKFSWENDVNVQLMGQKLQENHAFDFQRSGHCCLVKGVNRLIVCGGRTKQHGKDLTIYEYSLNLGVKEDENKNETENDNDSIAGDSEKNLKIQTFYKMQDIGCNYYKHGMSYVPTNSDDNEFVLFGSKMEAKFVNTLKWFNIDLSGKHDSNEDEDDEDDEDDESGTAKITMSQDNTKLFQDFPNQLILNNKYFGFGYCIILHYLVLFGGQLEIADNSEKQNQVISPMDCIFYFNFRAMQWFQSNFVCLLARAVCIVQYVVHDVT